MSFAYIFFEDTPTMADLPPGDVGAHQWFGSDRMGVALCLVEGRFGP